MDDLSNPFASDAETREPRREGESRCASQRRGNEVSDDQCPYPQSSESAAQSDWQGYHGADELCLRQTIKRQPLAQQTVGNHAAGHDRQDQRHDRKDIGEGRNREPVGDRRGAKEENRTARHGERHRDPETGIEFLAVEVAKLDDRRSQTHLCEHARMGGKIRGKCHHAIIGGHENSRDQQRCGEGQHLQRSARPGDPEHRAGHARPERKLLLRGYHLSSGLRL